MDARPPRASAGGGPQDPGVGAPPGLWHGWGAKPVPGTSPQLSPLPTAVSRRARGRGGTHGSPSRERTWGCALRGRRGWACAGAAVQPGGERGTSRGAVSGRACGAGPEGVATGRARGQGGGERAVSGGGACMGGPDLWGRGQRAGGARWWVGGAEWAGLWGQGVCCADQWVASMLALAAVSGRGQGQ